MNKTVVKYLLVCACAACFAAPASAATEANAAGIVERVRARARGANEPPAEPLPRVEVSLVKRLERVNQGIDTTSTLEPLEEVILIPKVTGRIASIPTAKGELVEVGDQLVILDSSTQEAEYASLKAQVAVSRAELEQSKVSLTEARRERDRYGRLRQTGAATQQEYDTRSTTYDAAVASQTKAQAQVQMSQANLDAKNVELSEYKLLASIRGVVLEDYDFVPGALVSPSTNVIRLGSVDRLKAKVSIPERDMSRVVLGMEAQFVFESLPNQVYYGTVTLIDPYINTNTRTLGAEVTINNQATGFALRPGMFARVLLIENTEENPLVVPSEALRSDGTVMVVRDGKTALQNVTTGATTRGMVTITEGLEIGEAVVVSGGRNVAPDTEVDMVLVDQ